MKKLLLGRSVVMQFLALLFFLLAIRVLYFYLQPEEVLVGVIPDDAFYYLDLARHRATFGVWSLDGVTTATGFHLLYAYLLLAIYKIAPQVSIHTLFLIIGVLSVLAISSAAYFTAKVGAKFTDRYGGLIALAPFFAWASLIQVSQLMESWLVIYCSALSIYLILNESGINAVKALGLFIAGVLGSLARSDFGMLPGVLFACLLFGYPWWGNRLALFRTFFLLLGAASGVGLVLLHNFAISGHIFQSSAQTKLYWSLLFGHKIYAPLSLFSGAVIPMGGGSFPVIVVLALISILCILSSLVFFKSGPQQEKSRRQFILMIACASVIMAYLNFYRFNSEALQIWYFANFLIPYCLLLAIGCSLAFPVHVKSISYFIVGIYLTLGLSKLFHSPWPYQKQMMAAGQYIALDKSGALYGAWNAGIVNYYSGGKVINLDGLVNDEVLDYIKSNRLFNYLKDKNIRFIVDDVEMLSTPRLQKKGGYEDERMERCIKLKEVINTGSYGREPVKMGLFEIQEGCP